MSMGIVKLHQVFIQYQNLLVSRWGANAVRMDGPPPEVDKLGAAQIDHLLWMCEQADIFLGQAITLSEAGDKEASKSKIEKAYRWLGFIQGSFWILNIRTVDEMKNDSMPEGEVFDRSKI